LLDGKLATEKSMENRNIVGKILLFYLVGLSMLDGYVCNVYAFIIQQIVTLSKYGHDALDICHP